MPLQLWNGPDGCGRSAERQDRVKLGSARFRRAAGSGSRPAMLVLAAFVVAAVVLGALVAPWVFLVAVAAALMWLTLALARVV
jgi:hypothetical protein